MKWRRDVVLIAGAAACAAAISMVVGVLRAQTAATHLRRAGFPAEDVAASFEREIARWAALALATSAAVAFIVAADRFAAARHSRWIPALLVIAAPVALMAVGVAAYVPEGAAIPRRSYVNVGELPLFWGVISGAPLVILFHFIGRVWNRAEPDLTPENPDITPEGRDVTPRRA